MAFLSHWVGNLTIRPAWHNPKTMRAAFRLAVLLSFIAGCSKPQVAPSRTPQFNELSDSDRVRFGQQRAASPVKQFRLIEKGEFSGTLLQYVCKDTAEKKECVEGFYSEGAVWAGDVNDDGVDEYIIDPGGMPGTMGPARELIRRRGSDWVDLACLGEENECESGWNTLRGRFDIFPIIRGGYHDLRIMVDRCLKWNGQHYIDYAPVDYAQLHEEWFDTNDSHEAELFWRMQYQFGKNTRFEPRWFTVSAEEFSRPAKAYISLPARVVEFPKLPYASRQDPKLGLKWVSFFKGGVWGVKGDRAFLLVPQPSYLGAPLLELRGDWLLIYGEVEDSPRPPDIRYNRRTHELRYAENQEPQSTME